MKTEVMKIGKRETPKDHGEGTLIRKAVTLPVEHYSLERKAEFILSNATNKTDYARARKEVKKLGLDPDCIPHYKNSKHKKEN